MSATDTIPVQRTVPKHLEGLVQLVARPARPEGGPPDLGVDVEFYGELGLLECPGKMELGICIFRRRPMVLDKMERHVGTPELLYAVDDSFIAVAAPDAPGGGAPDPSALVALEIHRGEGLVFARGCWHWAPYPFAKESFALVGFARGTATADMDIRPLGREITISPR